MKNQPKVGGWLPDSTMPGADKSLDHVFSQNLHRLTAPNIPATETAGVLDLRVWCSPVEDQGSAGSCVGNGIVGALEFLQIRNGMRFVDLSRLFVYYNSRLMTQDQNKDNGTYIRLAFGTLSALGTCSEATWAYDLKNLFTRPNWSCYREAYANKVSNYYSIDVDGQERTDQIKQALRSQHVVVFGMEVDQGFMDTGKDGVVPAFSGNTLGGHCTCIVGYDDNRSRFIVRNSWGTGWGDSGYCYLLYSDLDARGANDFWVPTLSHTIYAV